MLKHLGDVSVSEIDGAVLNISNGNYKKIRHEKGRRSHIDRKDEACSEGRRRHVPGHREDVYAQDVVGAVRTAPAFCRIKTSGVEKYTLEGKG